MTAEIALTPTTAADLFDRDIEVIAILRQIIHLASPDKDALMIEDGDTIRLLADQARLKIEAAGY